MNVWRNVALLACMALLAGCEGKSTLTPVATPSNPPPANPQWPPTKAQPKLQTVKLWLGSQELTAELALTQLQIGTGMMFRKEMAENEGMLFVFARPDFQGFWMKNVSLPLSCAYMDSEGIILEIHDMRPFNEASIPSRSDQVQFVLEVKQGWFERNKVGVGALVRTEHGSFQATFFGKR